MRFENLDLNLLVALDVLLTERNTTIAAERLFLSQSSVSGALGRLRDYFDDDLLRPLGRSLVLTSRAETLKAPVRQVLDQITEQICQIPKFDPKTSRRHCTIVASDYVVRVGLDKAFAALSKLAPNMTFSVCPVDPEMHGLLEGREIDLLINLEHVISDRHPSISLFDDEYVGIAWDKNNNIREPVDIGTYSQLGHVAVQFGRARLAAIEEDLLRELNVRRRIEVRTLNFSSLPELILGTQRIATVQRRLADCIGIGLPLKIFELPVEIPKIKLSIQWHRACSNDVGLMWTVSQIVSVFSSLK